MVNIILIDWFLKLFNSIIEGINDKSFLKWLWEDINLFNQLLELLPPNSIHLSIFKFPYSINLLPIFIYICSLIGVNPLFHTFCELHHFHPPIGGSFQFICKFPFPFSFRSIPIPSQCHILQFGLFLFIFCFHFAHFLSPWIFYKNKFSILDGRSRTKSNSFKLLHPV